MVYVAPSGELLKCDLCGGDPVCVKACATRPEKLNAGKQYPRFPVLFYETKGEYSAILRRPRGSEGGRAWRCDASGEGEYRCLIRQQRQEAFNYRLLVVNQHKD